MNYIIKHWKGELPLVISFWVNVILVNLIIGGALYFLNALPLDINPKFLFKIVLSYKFFSLLFIFPWQIIGLWRASNRYRESKKKVLWPALVKTWVILGIFVAIGNFGNEYQDDMAIFKLAFMKDEYSNYQINVVNNGRTLHLKGTLGFGVHKDVEKVVSRNKNIDSIILDSSGGRLYEARKLSNIVLDNEITTYSTSGCSSVCALVFMSGKKRFLTKSADLSFHSYSMPINNQNININNLLSQELSKDFNGFINQGVDEEFINKLNNVELNEMWTPSFDDMLKYQVIHGVVNESDLIPEEHREADIS